MLHFDCDYMEGAHPAILKKLSDTNMEQTAGYGRDAYCDRAKQKIRQICQCPQADIHFLVGGTQTNATVIKTLLRSYEGVISADTGHISVHEAGAIEATGHKVLTLPHDNGKLRADLVESYLIKYYNDDARSHMVKPGLVYISHPTEYGTLYTKQELIALKTVCEKYNMPLFLDGARLGYGLMAQNTDVTLPFIASVCDVFYIGGTKIGALFGEAVVVTKPSLVDHFFTIIKQQGALLAKGRILGIQFDTLFSDNLYFDISKHAIAMAEKLKAAFMAKGYSFYIDSPTNQQFIILDNTKMNALAKHVSFSFWEAIDEEHTVVRFATSWATKPADVEQLIELL